MSAKLGFLMAGIPEAERVTRCRELRALALVYLGMRQPATIALAEAVALIRRRVRGRSPFSTPCRRCLADRYSPFVGR